MNRIRSERRGPVELLTLDRPKAFNALDRAALEELLDCCERLGADASVRSVVLTGEGRAFAAGADIAEMRGHDAQQAEAFSRLGQAVMDAFESLPVPTIAAVNGLALGGGCELACACDWIYASEKARFGQPEVKLGLIPGFGGTGRLVRRIGSAWAKELVLGGEPIDAETALRIGLVNRLFAPDALVASTLDAAEKIAAKGPHAIATAKRVILQGQDADARTAHALEQAAFGLICAGAERAEGMDAFLEKREPSFEER
jgi:enoyl-CoA hydratase